MLEENNGGQEKTVRMAVPGSKLKHGTSQIQNSNTNESTETSIRDGDGRIILK
jgi:hypothetical protein